MRFRRLFSTSLIIFSVQTVFAIDFASKPAWQWDVEERVQQRCDPARAAERRNAAAARCGDGPCGTGKFIVDGSRNPELLMPSELMDALSGAFDARDPELRDSARQKWQERVPDLNLDSAFWNRLFEVGKPFFIAWTNYLALGDAWNNATPAERARLNEARNQVFDRMCPLRADALAAARQTFGRDVFDRLLYEAIAPGMFVSESGRSPSLTLWIERGCR